MTTAATPSPPGLRSSSGPSAHTIELTAHQLLILQQLVSVYENSSTKPVYTYVADLHDGCGYTAGWVGFCTATGDLVQVVRLYDGLRPDNPLRRYYPELVTLARTASPQISRLRGFPAAWRRACRAAVFISAQTELAQRLYLNPAIKLAYDEGLRTPLAAAIFFETAVQHGIGTDPDGLPALIARTAHRAGGRPGAKISEKRWLTVFDYVRLRDLLHPYDTPRLADWPESADRARSDQRLVKGGYFNLSGLVHVTVFGSRYVLGR